eukprot:COSAG01_NODE_898_length_12870_cov_27.573800_1_plen_176_part_00
MRHTARLVDLAQHLCGSTACGDGTAAAAAATAAAAAALTDEELREYAREGLVVPKGWRLPGATDVSRLQQLVRRTLAVTCERSPPALMPVAPHLPTNLYGAHGRDIPEELAASWICLARHPDILSLVHSVLGPDMCGAAFVAGLQWPGYFCPATLDCEHHGAGIVACARVCVVWG